MTLEEARALLGQRRIQHAGDGETFIRRCTKVDALITINTNGTESADCWRVWSDGRFGRDRKFETFMPLERWLAMQIAPAESAHGSSEEQGQ